MGNQPIDLRPFAKRVRLVRAWRGLAIGLLAGGALGLVWALLDLAGVYFTEWPLLVVLFLGSGLLACLVGALLPIKADAVARSVDKRAGLRDRIGTAIERSGASETFDAALVEDAIEKVLAIKAASVFPVKVGKWQYAAFCAVALASTVFLLGNAWPLLSPEVSKAKEELKKISLDIERVAKPIMERKDATDAELAFAKSLQDFAKRLDKGRIDKEEAMQRANELAEQAKKLTEKRIERSLKEVQTAREQMTRSELESKGLDSKQMETLNDKNNELLKKMQSRMGKAGKMGDNKFSPAMMEQMGLQDIDPSLLNLTEKERESVEKYIKEELEKIEKQLKDSHNLTPDQLNKLYDDKANLEALKQALEISEKARKILEEFMNSPEYKDIMKQVNDLRKAAKQVADGKPLSEEQIKQLEKGLEELAEKLKDSKYREEVMEALRKALEELKAGHATCEAGGT